MRELTTLEIKEVSGGHPLVWGVIGGMIGDYIYQSIGEMAGINDFFSGINSYFTNQALQQGQMYMANPNCAID